MERFEIDKESAKYAEHKTTFRKEVLKEVNNDDYERRRSDCREDFKAGAEWQLNPCVKVFKRKRDLETNKGERWIWKS